ncbi:MAG: metalloregulator ArsR/SmtB family transcription factor [Nitrospirae bacterium]|nr:metalloregulator ArsR/SmtB family transcription factor [Nitrospirota bacterium]
MEQRSRSLAELFRALGDETRLQIVALLSHGELCVCHLQAALETSQPNVSRHLAVLRGAGLVEVRREGTWMRYRLRPQDEPERGRLLQALTRSPRIDDRLVRKLLRLRKTMGPAACR